MRISHKHKFVFIAVAKTGSTSIRYILDEYSDIKSQGDFNKPYFHHVSAEQLQHHFNKKNWKWDDYFKFTFARNPYSRLVSWWNYIQTQYQSHQQNGISDGGEYWKNLCNEIVTTHKDFKSFVRAENPLWFPRTSSEFISDKDENNLLDFIGRTENLQEDFDFTCDKIKIPRQQLPHKNKSNHKHYTEYYDDETKEIVAEVFAKDIEYFGYEFGE